MSTASWETRKLSDLADMCLGKMLDQKKNKGDYYPYLANLNVRWGSIDLDDLREMRFEKKEFERYGLKYGDIVMCEGGEPGRCAYWKNQAPSMMIQKALHRIRARENVDSLFLFYALLHKGLQGHFDGYFTGAAIKHLTGENLAKIEVKLPEYSKQKKIAAVLETYDDLIENNLKRIKLLEEMAQITYEEWFVRMKFPGYETAVFDEETGLPDGWQKGQLSNLVSFLNGYAFKSEEFVSSGSGVIKIKNIEGGNVDVANLDKIDDESSERAKKFQLFSGDKVIAMTGATVGKVGLIPRTTEALYLNQRVGKLMPLPSGDNTFLAYCFLGHDIGYQQVLNMASGAAQPNISGEAILSAKTVIPNKELLSKFEQFGSFITSQILNLRSQNNLLQEARDILLPRLMTGMIDIEQVEFPGAMLNRLEQQEDKVATAV